jgi:PPOX class probable F420-dependent enzyme
MLEIPATVRRLLADRNFWVCATVSADGAATATPVWTHVDERHILVNTGAGRLKERNVRRDPRLALALVVPDDPYSWVEIRGRVVEFVEGQKAEESFADFARKYLGYPLYASPIPGEARVLLRIEPTRVGFRTEPGVRLEGGST